MNTDSIKDRFAQVFENDYQGYEYFIENVVNPIFTGDDAYEPLPVPEEFLTDEKKRQRANESGILSILKVGTVDAEEPVDLYDITLSDRKELQYNRVGIQQVIRSELFSFTNAFMLFHNETPEGKDWRFSYAYKETTQKSMTSAKRYTYLFGKNHRARTASERFAKLANEEKSTEKLLAAFSVEALSKDFFNEYKNQYNAFCQFMVTHKNDTSFFGTEIADWEDKSLRDYVKKMMGRITFIYFLQRKGWINGDMQYMQNAFQKSPHQDDYLDMFLEPLFFGVLNTKQKDRKTLFEKEDWELALLDEWEKVPYLNGGLFERDEHDLPKSKFPAEMFKNLFDFYSRYNFTIDENDPDDAEVGVDPEMLGHIFENLLEDNKDKGAFYTPKEIVQYMSQESITQYLKTHTEEALHAAIEGLIKERKVDEALQNKASASKVYDLLCDVKVCDPAIGSGAFPMGVLNVLYHSRQVLYGFTKSVEAFSPAAVKREIIQNNIYGVDIEKGAVDIARLRFWLALVVDEIQPEPLPNLDFKIMQGNSLLEQFEGLDLSNLLPKKNDDEMLIIFDEEAKLHAILHEYQLHYFSVTDHEEKQTLRKKIVDVVKRLIIERTQGNANIPDKLNDLDLSANSDFFLWHTWFKDVFDKGGFDIVIGNPPYVAVRSGAISDADKKEYKSIYKSAKGQFDLYALFIEKGINILKDRGNLMLITESTFVSNKDFVSLRKIIVADNKLAVVAYLGEEVFKSAKVDVTISSIIKEKYEKEHKIEMCQSYDDFLANCFLKIHQSIFDSKESNYEIKVRSNLFDLSLFEKLKSKGCELGNIAEMPRGAEFGANFEEIKDYKLNKKYYPLLVGKDIKQYSLNFVDRFIPFNKSNVSVYKEFWIYEQPKLFIQRIRNLSLKERIVATYDDEGYICTNTLRMLYLKDENLQKKYSLKYILALLNSTLINHIFRKLFLNKDIYKYQLEQIPIPAASSAEQRPFIKLVDKVLEKKKADSEADTSTWEAEIDKLVYELYGLTEEEVKVVEGK